MSEETGNQEPVKDKAEDANVVESSRYPQRERRAPAYLNDYATDHVNVVEDQVHVEFCYRFGVYPKSIRKLYSPLMVSSGRVQRKMRLIF